MTKTLGILQVTLDSLINDRIAVSYVNEILTLEP